MKGLWTVVATDALQGRSAFNFILQSVKGLLPRSTFPYYYLIGPLGSDQANACSLFRNVPPKETILGLRVTFFDTKMVPVRKTGRRRYQGRLRSWENQLYNNFNGLYLIGVTFHLSSGSLTASPFCKGGLRGIFSNTAQIYWDVTYSFVNSTK